MRVRKKPRQRESKERLQRNFVEEDTSQVPQADDLAKIMDIVGLVRDNENKLEQIAKKMHFTTRQSQYYCKAAEILGLIERIGSEGGSNLYVDSIGTGFHLTLHGISFLKKTIDERIDDLKNEINRIPIYKKFIDELKLKRNWSIEEIEQFFVKNAGLSNATAQRRSRTMIRWLFYLDLVEIRRKNVIFKDSNAKQLSMSDEINPQNNFILDEYQVSLVRDFYKVRKNWHGSVSDSNFLKYLEENGIFVDKYTAEWGSWEKFLGHATDTSIPNQVSMIIEYEKLKDDLDHIPTAFEMFKQGRYGLEPYKTEFGNWESFLRLVGDLEVTKDELVKEYAQEKELYGGSPTVPEMNDFGRYRYDDYVNAFGSWSAFLNYFEDKEDELDLEKTDSKTKIVNENAIIDDYNNLKAILLRTPTMEEIKDFGEYKIDDYVQIFGSYKLFLEKIGDLEKIDDQLEMELVKQYYELKESMGGQQPTAEELDTFGAYSLDDYKKVFGSWVGFQMHLEELERGERVTKLEKTTKEDLVSSYYRLKSKVGHIPSISELNQLGDYGHEFY
ncbi:MAG: hypothetical protein KGL95_05615, partial [Patescibacteria group bacterium]|nr:hypothetical protein [Patescibacteria group bacterium]